MALMGFQCWSGMMNTDYTSLLVENDRTPTALERALTCEQ